ncbi:MAG: hypothetical protein A2V69_00745 [Candidatus Portnoybacteria bacterium RBG_13_40_8]|uniref:DUF3307 domain-containing protein n=1 Tax=Candidatus Portnoybacteria bacterium RBG_13_40_8 TaxID=1801990 RepID=A0A1G2F5L9_9BACT|nr:MAG: hypothetical protein A2V69_00745 [Candidatus Portnoybacteria bacterium RBG_13_40_8]OGZ35091.1 MAG: hypothetical protein A2V60_02210 [Candidatus Portnoybacteria bacterium RIFCSPHIGHO2_01_FULL_39_19]
MVLIPHILAGAVIGAKTHNLGLIIILGLITHLILDKLPHWDYINHGIRNFSKTKDFKALFCDLFKILIDGLIGFLIVLLTLWFSSNVFMLKDLIFILLGIFFAILPDIFLFSFVIIGGNFSEKYINLHHQFFHTYKNKEKEGKITFFGLITQILVIIISIIILFS